MTGAGTTANPLPTAENDSGTSTSDYTFTMSLLDQGKDTLTINLWTTVEEFSFLYGLRSDSQTMDTGNLPLDLPENDTGLRALSRTAILTEFVDENGDLIGSDTTTSDISDRFAYKLTYTLSRETTRLFHNLGFDTSINSTDFGYTFADTYGAPWQTDSSDVTVDTNARGGINLTVSVLDKDLPGAPGGSQPGGGPSSKQGCLIERIGPPDSLLNSFRSIRDDFLDSKFGRWGTVKYYRWFGSGD